MVASPAEQENRRRRLIEAAVAILAASPKNELGITLLNKALFYLDLYALRELGHTATRALFLALPQGPVVANYPKKLVAALEKAGLAKQSANATTGEKPVRLEHPLERFEYLSAEEVQLAAEVVQAISTRTAKAWSDFSHENLAWSEAYEGGLKIGKQPLPINMRLAMQQILEDDDWIDSKLSKAEGEAIDTAVRAGADSW